MRFLRLTSSQWKAINGIVLVLVIALNGLAATGAMSGQSIGVIANQYRSLFLPANYVFGIWSLIYTGLIASTVYQLWPGPASTRAVERLGPWWLVEGVLNVAWISLFSFGQFALALAVMLVFLVSLILLGERLREGAAPTWMERLCLIWPQDIYLAWISVAVIANSFQFVHVIGWDGFGIPESQWSVLLMGVATLLGVFMAWGRGNWLFPFVVAWALWGIKARYPELPALTSAVSWLVPAGIVGGLLAWVSGLRRRVPTSG